MNASIIRRLTISIAVMVMVIFSGLPCMAEYIFLKDGSIISGTVVKDHESYVIIKTPENERKKLPRDQIIRIQYTKIKMGQVYVQKRDGTGLVAYVVDEDQDSYKFRKDITRPEEFSINRSDILFIAEKNPSGLKMEGEPGTDRVSLAWLPPYDATKKYNIYLKKKKSDKYELADSTTGKFIVLKNLSSNTTYYIAVTSVDRDDNESLPSNELKITTKNRPPAGIVSATVTKNPSGDMTISFSETTDADGKVEGYRLYRVFEGKKEKIAEVKASPITVKDTGRYDKLLVAAFDDLGAESEAVRARSDEDIANSVECAPVVIFPMKRFSTMVKPGYGLLMRVINRGYLPWDMSAGIETGFIYFRGKSFGSKEGFSSVAVLPLMLGVSQKYAITGDLSLNPELYAGLQIFRPAYRANEPETGATYHVLSKRMIINYGFRAGIGFLYQANESLSMNAGVGIACVREESRGLLYSQVTVGAGYRL